MEVKEPAVAYGNNKFTVEEYLKLEKAATERHEFYQGEIFQMQGAWRIVGYVWRSEPA